MLAHPTEELVLSYVQRFEETPGYFTTYNALQKLFLAFPDNTRLEEVLLKVTALNSLYNTNIDLVGEFGEGALIPIGWTKSFAFRRTALARELQGAS